MYISKNFKLNDRVVFHSTGSELDGQFGTVLSDFSGPYRPSLYPPPYQYVILMDTMYYGQQGINITEACLSLIK